MRGIIAIVLGLLITAAGLWCLNYGLTGEWWLPRSLQ